jgi:hypothetical protein
MRYALANKRLDCRRVLVKGDALVTLAREAAHDIAAHAPQSNHAELHRAFSSLTPEPARAQREGSTKSRAGRPSAARTLHVAIVFVSS